MLRTSVGSGRQGGAGPRSGARGGARGYWHVAPIAVSFHYAELHELWAPVQAAAARSLPAVRSVSAAVRRPPPVP